MNIKQENVCFEKFMREIGCPDWMFIRDSDGGYEDSTMVYSWSAWCEAKRKSVPDGFVLVSREIQDSVVDRLENSSYHWGDGTRAYFTPIYQMMIEAQELSNEDL